MYRPIDVLNGRDHTKKPGLRLYRVQKSQLVPDLLAGRILLRKHVKNPSAINLPFEQQKV
jgi:hypothetical protein